MAFFRKDVKIHIVLLYFLLIASLGILSGSEFTENEAFAENTITDRTIITANSTTSDGNPLDVAANELFGYQIEPIGDLDSDGVTDLAVIKFEADLLAPGDNFGSVLIMFMNNNGTVKGTNEIFMNATAGLGIGASCIAGDGTNRDSASLEQLAFVGDIAGVPILALGASSNNHPDVGTGEDSGAVYMLELNTDGTVADCVRIIPGENGFAPDDGVYNEIAQGNAALGWPLIATDLNGDGQNELIVGADSEDDNYTNLWPLFLTTGGVVSSHPAIPIFGNVTNIGITSESYIDDGISINGGTKIGIGVQGNNTIAGSVFIVDVTSAGAFVSSTEITGISVDSAITAATDAFGSGMAPLGDLDADGVNDILVGNELGDDTNVNSGEVHILYMNSDNTVKESQKISNETEEARGAGTFLDTTDLFGHGMALWQVSGGTAYVAISATQDDTGGGNTGAIHIFSITKTFSGGVGGNSGNNCSDCTDPTFYYSKHNLIVENAFTYNDYSTDVTDRFTEIDLIETKINQQNKLILKVYDNGGTDNIKWVDVGFGIPEFSTIFDKSEVTIEIKLKNSKVVNEDLKITDPLNLIDFGDISSKVVNCGYLDKGCLQVTIPHSFRDGFVNSNLIISASDYEPNKKNHIISKGINIQGDTVNPLPTDKLFIKKHLGSPNSEWVIITLIDRSNNIWTSEDGLEFKSTSGGGYKRITPLGPIPNLE